MPLMNKITVLLVAISCLCCSPDPQLTEIAGEAVNVLTDPVQTTSEEKPFALKRGGYDFTITPKASYDISAQVKSLRYYSSAWVSLLSPVDFALAWQNLTKEDADRYITYSQSNRWYYYRYRGGCPYSKTYIIGHSANVHILPATENLRRATLKVSSGDRIRLKGWLVSINGQKKGSNRVWWHSSLSRSDQGDGACELLWLTELQKGTNIYR